MSLIEQYQWMMEKDPERIESYKRHQANDFNKDDEVFTNICDIFPDTIIQPQKHDSYFYVPSSPYVIFLVAQELNKVLEPGSIIYDIGSGIGRVCFLFAHLCPTMKVKGVEYEQEYVDQANKYKEQFSFDNCEFICDDVLNHNFSDANFIYFYAPLVSKQAEQFKAKIRNEVTNCREYGLFSFPRLDVKTRINKQELGIINKLAPEVGENYPIYWSRD